MEYYLNRQIIMKIMEIMFFFSEIRLNGFHVDQANDIGEMDIFLHLFLTPLF